MGGALIKGVATKGEVGRRSGKRRTTGRISEGLIKPDDFNGTGRRSSGQIKEGNLKSTDRRSEENFRMSGDQEYPADPKSTVGNTDQLVGMEEMEPKEGNPIKLRETSSVLSEDLRIVAKDLETQPDDWLPAGQTGPKDAVANVLMSNEVREKEKNTENNIATQRQEESLKLLNDSSEPISIVPVASCKSLRI